MLLITLGVTILLLLGGRLLDQAGASPHGGGRPAMRQAASPANGRTLYLRDCAWCHGAQGGGTSFGSPLLGVGALSADFMLSTGRMPLSSPEDPSARRPPAYTAGQVDALVAFVATLGEGPAVPDVDPGAGSLTGGNLLYQANCAACHSSTGAGGALTSGQRAPALYGSTPVQTAEAVRLGPGTMPAFSAATIPDAELDSIVRYVEDLKHPNDRGGNGLGHVGPVTEGLVALVVGLGMLVLTIRWIARVR